MKELEQNKPTAKVVEQEYQLVGKITPGDGHSIFSVNIETKEIQLESTENKRINAVKGYAYISALNKKNAMKKFYKMYGKSK